MLRKLLFISVILGPVLFSETGLARDGDVAGAKSQAGSFSLSSTSVVSSATSQLQAGGFRLSNSISQRVTGVGLAGGLVLCAGIWCVERPDFIFFDGFEATMRSMTKDLEQ